MALECSVGFRAPTGYGNQTSLFAPALKDHYDIAISSFWGLDGSRLRWEDITVFPGLSPEFGNVFLTHHAKDHFGGDLRDGLVFTLMDVWVLDPAMASRLNMVSWCPVDHEPAPPKVTQFFAKSNAVPVAMSRFGQRQLEHLDPLYVPHGVDTDAYKPRADAKSKMGLPDDAFLVGMVAANKGRAPSRKGFQQALEAFSAFHKVHSDSMLYLHTVMEGEFSAGEDLWAMVEAFDVPRHALATADQYKMVWNPYSPVEMSHFYSGMDVLLSPSMGEGFGIPILEAQACGTPVIVTDFSAMPEVGKVGWHVEHRPFWTGQGTMQAMADVGDLVESLRHCYSLSTAAKNDLAVQAREHAETYAVERVLEEHMLPALAEAQERFRDREPLEAVAA